MALHSANGTVAVANTRSQPMPALNGVAGASFIGIFVLMPITPFTLLAVDCLASVLPKVAAAEGNDLAAFINCPSELENTEPIILPIFKSDSRIGFLLGLGCGTLRGVGLKSISALASITPPLPSSAA